MSARRERYKNILQMIEERLTFGEDISFSAAEAYKLLRTNILFALPDAQRCRVIGVTSAGRGEGKSTTALNLSHMLAEAGERVLLIEADMRLPAISRRLGLRAAPGLSNVLAGLRNAGEAIHKSGLHEHLQIVSSGDIPPNPSELLGSRQMNTLMETVSGSYDFIVMDLPPVNGVPDALVASKLTDGMIVVVRQRYATRRALAEAMQKLQYAEAKVLGFVTTYSEIQTKGKKYKG